ncbi:MAG TPA: DNA mismatch repair protein MutS [Treponemataceae bacterium]|nr:DNA mismatch repair protein MutS [Treponemataceae bacterium]
MNKQTPLMQQYQRIKNKYQDEVLFFRLGDFYEMFDDDAIEVSRLLNLTLTHRGQNPMCGIPHHASKLYIARLLRLGKKIAICEQVQLPTSSKGIAERKVVEVITPGTALDEEYLEMGTHNFLAAVCSFKKKISWAYMDVSTGDFFATSWDSDECCSELKKELGRVQPRELIISKSLFKKKEVQQILQEYPTMSFSREDDWHFGFDLSTDALKKQFGTINLRPFGLTDNSPEVVAAGYLLRYVIQNSTFSQSSTPLPHVTSLSVYADSSRRNLELTNNLRDGGVTYSLLECLAHTKTAMGNRQLRSFFMHPLKNIDHIKNREQHVSVFVKNIGMHEDIRGILGKILDIERLASRIVMERAHAKDIQALRLSLEYWLKMRRIAECYSGELGNAFCVNEIDTAESICDYIEKSVLDDPSTSITEGRLIKDGWSKELDYYRNIKTNFTQSLQEYLDKLKEKTGISNMKIKYTNNMGYCLEVSKGKIGSVPSFFVLRRALVNANRYTTDKLRELETELISAHDNIIELEKKLFLEIRSKISTHVRYLLSIATEISYIDAIASFAWSARLYNWVCPDIDATTKLEIKKGRHPVVEAHMPTGEFVPNDTSLCDANFVLITGPNMAGKSTYLRQNALIVFLAQIGSFVPAQRAKIGIVDRIFCRVGASDNLARGESTFLVEMTETALILRAATKQSLVIMDEVGRGTSTEDGLSIAWAVSEYILNSIGARTFFATHYHELTRISHKKLKLLQMQVAELDGEVVFLKKIQEGAAESSYGIHVAKLAGIPLQVVNRASEILANVQKKTPYTELATKKDDLVDRETKPVLSPTPGLFTEEELVLQEILSAHLDDMTPLEALQMLANCKKKLSGE